jgi:hypothetical protein
VNEDSFSKLLPGGGCIGLIYWEKMKVCCHFPSTCADNCMLCARDHKFEPFCYLKAYTCP